MSNLGDTIDKILMELKRILQKLSSITPLYAVYEVTIEITEPISPLELYQRVQGKNDIKIIKMWNYWVNIQTNLVTGCKPLLRIEVNSNWVERYSDLHRSLNYNEEF